MAACIQNLQTVLKLPRNSHISEVSLSPLTEAPDVSFSSSLKRLKIRWNVSSVSNDETRTDPEHQGKHLQVGEQLKRTAKANDEGDADLSNEIRSGEMVLVAKSMPDPSLWVSLNSEATFVKELNMYSLMLPVYLDILERLLPKENSEQIDHTRSPHFTLFPKFYGGRLNLENRPDEVDKNALILLEDLSLSGYENCRKPKLDERHFYQILDKLALFHSVGIIIQQDPNFKDAFKNLLITTRPFFFGAKEKDIDKINAARRHKIMDIVEGFGYAKDVNERLLQVLVQTDAKTLPSTQTCYYSLIHNDLWINNIMFKYSKAAGKDEEETIDVKFIDFQNTNFGSVAKEFAFLFYTSVDRSLWNNLVRYISHYHDCLVHHLKTYFSNQDDCVDFISGFSLDRFKAELKTYTCHKLKHIFIIMDMAYSKNDTSYKANLKYILDYCVRNNFI